MNADTDVDTTDIHSLVESVDALIYSPSLGIGVSIDVPDHFDRIAGLFCSNVGTAQDAVQALRRVRRPKDTGIRVYLQPPACGLAKYPDEIRAAILNGEEDQRSRSSTANGRARNSSCGTTRANVAVEPSAGHGSRLGQAESTGQRSARPAGDSLMFRPQRPFRLRNRGPKTRPREAPRAGDATPQGHRKEAEPLPFSEVGRVRLGVEINAASRRRQADPSPYDLSRSAVPNRGGR